MSEYAMLIDYEYCTGCKSCEVACKQEYHRPSGRVGGVEVKEFIHRLPNDQLFITYIPTFTRACVFCAGRVKKGMAPACVKHCMANILAFGKLDDLRKQIPGKRKAILWTKG
jgi:Fe-S-cluster-containing dehydrogenase component